MAALHFVTGTLKLVQSQSW